VILHGKALLIKLWNWDNSVWISITNPSALMRMVRRTWITTMNQMPKLSQKFRARILVVAK